MRSEWTTGRSAHLAVPEPSSPSTIGKTGPRPTNVHLETGGPSPVKRANIPRAELPQGNPRRGQGPARTHESGRGIIYILRLGPANPGLPGSQSNAAAARRHGSRSRVASSQECVDTHGASSQDDPARTPPSWNCLNRSTRLIDMGWRLPPFVGCFRSTPTVLDPMHGTTTRKGAGPKRRVTSALCCSPDGPALEVPSWLRH